MTRVYRIAVTVIVTLALWPAISYAGDKDAEKSNAQKPDVVAFDVKVVSGGTRWGPPQTTWRATYKKNGKTGMFKITFPHKALGKGTFSREEKSDTSVLLRDLGKALRGKVPEKVDQVDELPVTFYILGDKMSRTERGSFKAAPVGDWILVKIFVAKDRGEFHLNINEKTGKGEIRMKDPDQGDAVMGELAKVLSSAPISAETP